LHHAPVCEPYFNINFKLLQHQIIAEKTDKSWKCKLYTVQVLPQF